MPEEVVIAEGSIAEDSVLVPWGQAELFVKRLKRPIHWTPRQVATRQVTHLWGIPQIQCDDARRWAALS